MTGTLRGQLCDRHGSALPSREEDRELAEVRCPRSCTSREQERDTEMVRELGGYWESVAGAEPWAWGECK